MDFAILCPRRLLDRLMTEPNRFTAPLQKGELKVAPVAQPTSFPSVLPRAQGRCKLTF